MLLDVRQLISKIQIHFSLFHEFLGSQAGALRLDPCDINHINDLTLVEDRVQVCLVRQLGFTISTNEFFNSIHDDGSQAVLGQVGSLLFLSSTPVDIPKTT